MGSEADECPLVSLAEGNIWTYKSNAAREVAHKENSSLGADQFSTTVTAIEGGVTAARMNVESGS